jgi:hypothetical protein
MAPLPKIFVDCSHYEPHSHVLTGLNLTVQYDGSQAEVSILEMIPLPEPEQERGIRAELLKLGQAIVQAAQSPQGVVAHPFSQR